MSTKLKIGKDVYLDPRWQKKRLEILSRDEFKCRECGSSDKTLHVHHIYYLDDVDGPWDYDNYSLVSLCDICHKEQHESMKELKIRFFDEFASHGYCTVLEIHAALDALHFGGFDEIKTSAENLAQLARSPHKRTGLDLASLLLNNMDSL